MFLRQKYRAPVEMFYIAPTIDPADLWDSCWSFIWRTLVGNSRRDRSVQFSGFLVHELPLWKRMWGRWRRRGRGTCSLTKGGRDRFSVDGLLSNTRVHISISAMHDKTPGWTRDDKNEEELLSHSNRHHFRIESSTMSRDSDYKVKRDVIRYKNIN